MFLCVYLYLRSIIRGVLSCVFGLVFCFVFSNKKKCQQSRQLHNNNNNNKNIVILITIDNNNKKDVSNSAIERLRGDD